MSRNSKQNTKKTKRLEDSLEKVIKKEFALFRKEMETEWNIFTTEMINIARTEIRTYEKRMEEDFYRLQSNMDAWNMEMDMMYNIEKNKIKNKEIKNVYSIEKNAISLERHQTSDERRAQEQDELLLRPKNSKILKYTFTYHSSQQF